MIKPDYLRSRQRRGRWFHYYRRNGEERSLGVHGLHPTDPKVFAAYCAEHARWEFSAPETTTPHKGTFAWGLDVYMSGNHKWLNTLAEGTKKPRAAIYNRYRKSQGNRPLSTITSEMIEAALYAKGGHGAVNELKALKPVFEHLKKLRFITKNPCDGVKLEKPAIKGFETAGAKDLERFMNRWEVGTIERLIFDLALYAGAARADLCRLGRHHMTGNLIEFKRQKTGVYTYVPITPELRAVIAKTPDISPAFILNNHRKPFTKESLGNRFGEAAQEAGVSFRLHGLRKAFCVYWAENGKSTHEIAAMAGHTSLDEVERYTRAADRKRIISLIARAG
jgi:integrase